MPVARTGSRPGDTSYRISVARRRVGFTRRAPAGELNFATRTWRNGRRKGLKIPWEISREGSSPSVRTIFFLVVYESVMVRFRISIRP